MNEGKQLSLAARYRPQTFGDVAGQDMVKAVLSRACAEDRPACAYLFSGTRGVGKTTIARIFAKALNCAHAPVAEPCNECAQCRKIMQGSHVDVVEIDGASNNKVEDVRSLRETVGYAPMEGRYKVFIIDEAHMLTGSAFNALLKTLEEPPPRVVFIMATTEAHKFPVTIVSRCQHFTFRHLNEEELVLHLKDVLGKENLTYEEDAVRLIAKRAQGSVRDSMSLLDQTLALGHDCLTADVTREVLGLAGQEFFEKLFAAMTHADCASVVSLTQTILRRGIDIGFFIRELAGHFRNLFLLQQGGSGIAPVLNLTPGELSFLGGLVNSFPLAHLHAAWQLVLDSQRSIVQSTEPASSLELLLLNLTLLPRLLPIDGLPGQAQPPLAAVQPVSAVPPAQPAPRAVETRAKPAEARSVFEARKVVTREPGGELGYEARAIVVPVEKNITDRAVKTQSQAADDTPEDGDDDDVPAEAPSVPDFSWSAFCDFQRSREDGTLPLGDGELRVLNPERCGQCLTIKPGSRFQAERLAQHKESLEKALRLYLRNDGIVITIIEPEQTRSQQEMSESLRDRSELAALFSVFDVSVEHCRKRPLLDTPRDEA